MAISDRTKRKLFTLSGNQCAFPGCLNPILDTEHDVIVGQICHIKARSSGGPRYDPDQSPDERDGFDNLMLMCGLHNKIIDDPASSSGFTVEMLREYKQKHELQFHNTVVRPDLMQQFIRLLQIRVELEEAPYVDLLPMVESWMTRPDNQMGIDYYDFRVKLRNEGTEEVRNFRVEVEIPNAYANPTHSSPSEVRQHSRGAT